MWFLDCCYAIARKFWLFDVIAMKFSELLLANQYVVARMLWVVAIRAGIDKNFPIRLDFD